MTEPAEHGAGAPTAYPLQTRRLTVRLMRSSDLDTLLAYRNDPEVARLQDWTLPYTPEMASWLASQDELTDLDTGWTELAIDLDGEHIGDIALELDERRAQANIGFTISRAHWGCGYATEAALAVMNDLVERVGVVRITGNLDLSNIASARTLEAIGLVHSHDDKASFFWRGEWADTRYYAITAQEWREWRDRPVGPPDSVELVPGDNSNAWRWRRVVTHHSQRRFVATVDDSYADALFPEEWSGSVAIPVIFGIEADGEPAGFVMYGESMATMVHPYLWRFLIDRRHQGRGIGRRAMELLAARLASAGATHMTTSIVDGRGGPRDFYLGLGGTLTGEVIDGEEEIIIPLAPLVTESAAAEVVGGSPVGGASA